jgi:3-hydroxyacyl-CoA dehydrogenase/enoyl-CoA hydratase/3-hydroxybutyryl-CoA epimerase
MGMTPIVINDARRLAEGVVTTTRDADFGSLLNWGVLPFSGGPISHIHGTGVAKFFAQCNALAALQRERFMPPKFLRNMAAHSENLCSR